MAGIILAAGVLLSWPFRLDPSENHNSSLERTVAQTDSNTKFEFTEPAPPSKDGRTNLQQIVAKVASPNGSQTSGGFDLENHPSMLLETEGLMAQGAPIQESLDEARPAYKTSGEANSPLSSKAEWPQGVAHIVRNGDTLEKLAQRYLGDSNRGLDIFDFNRDLLSNPHLLPIGVELRIPVDHSQVTD